MAETVKDTERAQAGVRLLSALLVTVYAPILAWAGQLPAELATIMAIHGVAFLGVALLLRWAVIRWPGHYPARRLLAMLNDYAALGFHLILGGRALLPVYAVVLWMTIGYGVRYGCLLYTSVSSRLTTTSWPSRVSLFRVASFMREKIPGAGAPGGCRRAVSRAFRRPVRPTFPGRAGRSRRAGRRCRWPRRRRARCRRGWRVRR